MSVTEVPLPDQAFLQRYAQRDDCFADCYCDDVSGAVDLSHFIDKFYQSPLFRAERLILGLAMRKPSSRSDVTALAQNQAKQFAMWDVEARATDQIMLRDMGGRTRSWLMVRPEATHTRLYFGSAVTPAKPGGSLGAGVTALMGLHRLYSRLLLGAAASRLT